MYWPSVTSPVKEYGEVIVHLQNEVQLADHTVRTFLLQREKDKRKVKQFHFTAWPDFGVPEHPTPLLKFVRKVESSNPVASGPVIVHCRLV